MITEHPPAPVLPATRPVGPSGLRAVLPLARQESRRVLLHPVALLGWALLVVNGVDGLLTDEGPRAAHALVESLISFFPGVLLILAAHLVASRDHRAGSLEALAAAPLGSRERTAALLLTAVPAVALGLVAVLVIHGVNLRLDRYFPGVTPSWGQLVQGPVTLAGAITLGVMVARWTTARMAPVLVLVVLVAANIVMQGREDTLSYFGPQMTWARWGVTSDAWGGLEPGSPEWRIGYLVGLCALAALGSLLPTVRRPWWVVAAGVVTLAVTAGFAWQMLP